MASTYIDENSGRRKPSLGVSPLTIAGLGIAGAYGLGAMDSYARPRYMGLSGSTTASTFTMAGAARAVGQAGQVWWGVHVGANMGRAYGAALRGAGAAWGGITAGAGAAVRGAVYGANAMQRINRSIVGAPSAVMRGAVRAGQAIARAPAAITNNYFSAYGRARGSVLGAVSAARRGAVRAGQAIARAPANITNAYFSAYGRARGRVLGAIGSAMPKFPAWGGTTPAGLRWPGGAGDSAWNSISSGIFGTPGKIKAGIRAAWNAPLPRPQTVGSMLKRGAINTVKLPLIGVGALGSKAISLGGMGVAAGLGIWAGASMALLSFMPYSAQQGGAVRGTRVMGAAAPTFTSSRGPMSPNNLATNGLTQSLYNTRHGQH